MCILEIIIYGSMIVGLVWLGIWLWRTQTELLNQKNPYLEKLEARQETKSKNTCIKSGDTTTRVGCARCSGIAFKPVQVSEDSQMIYYDNLCKKCIKKWQK